MTRKDVVLAISEDVKAVDYLAMREQRDKHNKLVTRQSVKIAESASQWPC